jgi:hypothetical protein
VRTKSGTGSLHRECLLAIAAASLTIAATSTNNLHTGSRETSGKPEDGGTAEGEVTQASFVTKLTRAYAVSLPGPDGAEKLRVVLTNGAIPAEALASPQKLTTAAGNGAFSALIIDFDATRRPTRSTFFVKGVPPDLSVAEVTTYEPRPADDGSLAGRVAFKDPDFSFRYSVDFATPIYRPAAKPKAAAPADASSKDVARIELRNRELDFTKEAFFRAVMDNDADVVKLYLAAGMPPDASPRRDSPLKDAIDRGSTEVAQVLIAGGANVDWKDEYDQSLVMNACSGKRIAILQALIAAGADVNRPNKYKIAPLAVAAERGDLEAVRALLEGKAEVNARNDYGGSALSVAVLRGYTEVVKTLIAAGADVRRDEKELLETARREKHSDLVPIIEAAARGK